MKFCFIFFLLLSGIIQAQKPCTEAKIREITDSATRRAPDVTIDCSCTLPRNSTITKKLIFEGAHSSNVILDGAGTTINGGRNLILEIKSVRYYSTRLKKWRYERPENITLKNFTIIGSVRIWGMAKTGEGYESVFDGVNLMKESSRRSGHAERMQDAAPTNIVFDHVSIASSDRIPLYLSPGVTRFVLKNSEIKGSSSEVAVYLDAESAYNTFKNNRIFTTTTRELIAIDGSSHNVFLNNWFSSLNHGGLYLYRNCGQGGVARHNSPTGNTIINNVFFYNTYSDYEPAVFLGARSGRKPYCNDDIASAYGSGRSNLDYALFNIVMQNQIIKRSLKDMIRIALRANELLHRPDWVEANTPNYISYNETVTNEVKRNAGCYVGPGGFQKDFVLDGETIEVLEFSGGRPRSYKYRCSDGELTRTVFSSNISEVPYTFQVSGSNARKDTTVACPSGQRIIGAKAGCNLEFGSVSAQDLRSVSPNVIVVLKASENVSDGSCWINVNETSKERITLRYIDGLTRVKVGCREHDENGGDCHIKGVLYCR